MLWLRDVTIRFLDWGKAFCLTVIHCVKTDPACRILSMKMKVSGDGRITGFKRIQTSTLTLRWFELLDFVFSQYKLDFLHDFSPRPMHSNKWRALIV